MAHFEPRPVPPNESNRHTTVRWSPADDTDTHLVGISRSPQHAVCGTVIPYARVAVVSFDRAGLVTCGRCLRQMDTSFGPPERN